MAILFARASSEYLSVAASPISGDTLTIACWAKLTATTTNQAFVSMGASGANERYLLYRGTGSLLFFVGNGATTGQATMFPALMSNTEQWYHCTAVQSSSSARNVYQDGVAGTKNTTSITTPTPTSTYIGAYYTSGAVQSGFYADATIAEVGIWNVALTQSEITALAEGISPRLIRPASLVFYAPLIGNADPELEIRQGNSLAWTNTPTKAAHPRIYYPSAQILQFPSAAAAPGGLAANPIYGGGAAALPLRGYIAA